MKIINKFKRLKQFEKSLRIANEMLDCQGQDGNYNYDGYMLGLYNGMEYIISLLEVREPNFRNGKDINFICDKKIKKKIENIEEITYKPRKVQNAINALIRNQKKILERLDK